MKKLFTVLIALFLVGVSAKAQSITTSQPLNKNVVLEEYTGIHCTYCPQGHAIAASILADNPGRAAVIAIHQGSFASPSAGEPDYRTSFGDPLAAQTGLTGYPSGTVNRHVFSGTTTALGRGDWTASSDIILQQPSPVNVGIETSVDTVTRELTVEVELYYTANSTVPTNYINVALIQSHIFGPQTGGGAGNNYEHMHMLRHLITGQWGDPVSVTTQGTLVQRTYTYTIPDGYNNIPCVIRNCDVVVFVTESHQEILTGDVVPAVDGTNLYVGDISTTGDVMKLGHPLTETTFDLIANSNIAGPKPFKIKLVSDMPDDWSSPFIIDGQSFSDSTVVILEKGTPKPITLNVVPGYSPGFVGFVFEISSVDHPNAPTRYFTVSMISSVHTLLVNAAGDENAELHSVKYMEGLLAAGCDHLAAMPSNVFVKAHEANILSEIINIFYNCAWTFPAFTDAEALAAQSFVDNGKNLFVAGQDIGWDIMSGQAGNHGTPVTKNFYTNYLKATYADDGSTANNKFIANTSDPVYGAVATSNVVDVYGGNMYPDQITPRDNATATFYYNTALSKIGAVKSTMGNAKVTYFGIGLEMIQSVDVRNDILGKTYDWFMESVGISEMGSSTSSFIKSIMPNPAKDFTTVCLNRAGNNLNVSLLNLAGQAVLTLPVSEGTAKLVLPTSDLASGMYMIVVKANGQVLETRKLTVQ